VQFRWKTVDDQTCEILNVDSNVTNRGKANRTINANILRLALKIYTSHSEMKCIEHPLLPFFLSSFLLQEVSSHKAVFTLSLVLSLTRGCPANLIKGS
jgi:hypothetical protein